MQVSSLSTGAAAQLYQVGATTTRSTELQVTTAEGDRVTISTSSTRTMGYASVSAKAGGASASGAAFAASGSDRVTLSVEGNLNKEELQELMKIVKAFQRAAAKGDARQLLHRLTRPDLDTIATVSASARTETSVMAATASITAQAEAQPAAEATAGPVVEPLAA